MLERGGALLQYDFVMPPVTSGLLAFCRREGLQESIEVRVIAIAPVKLAILAYPEAGLLEFGQLTGDRKQEVQ